MAEWRQRVLDRLRRVIDSYERGDTELPTLQAEVDAAAAVLESPDAGLIARLRQAEADLETIRFTVPGEQERHQATAVLVSLREALREAPGR